MKNLMRFFVVCMLLSATTYAGNYTWTGTTNTSWNTNTNWNPNGIPGSSDTITINTTTTSLVLTGKQTVKRLVMTNDTLNLGGDTLEITGSAGFNGGLILNGVCYPQATGLLSFAGTTFDAEVKSKGQIKLNGCTFNSTAYFEHTGSAAGTGSGGNTFNGTTTLKNAGTSAFRLAGSANDTFNGDVTVISAATSGSGSMQLSAGGTSYFNGNIVVNSTSVFGISFSSAGAGSSVLATGKTISIGGSGFVGTLLLRNFTQLGTTAQSLTFNGILNIMNSEFNAALTSSSSNLLLTGNSFHGVCSFTKTGISFDYSAGGNHFYQDLTIQNNVTNTAIIRMASTNGDIYEGDVTLNTSTGFIQMAYADTSDFYGVISINNTKVNFNSGTGFVRISGSASQSIGGTTGLAIRKLIVNKSGGDLTLNQPMTIDSTLILTNGVINSDSINILTLKSTSTVTGSSASSHIDGPCKKFGNSAFVFPTGDDGRLGRIEISAPSQSTDAFVAEYSYSQIISADTFGVGIDFKNQCSQWKITRTAGTSNVDVNLYWDSSACSILDSADLRVANWDGSKWIDLGATSFAGLTNSGKLKNSASIPNYTYFTLAYKTTSEPTADLIQDTIIDADSILHLNVQSAFGTKTWFPSDLLTITSDSTVDIETKATRYFYLTTSDYKGRSAVDSVYVIVDYSKFVSPSFPVLAPGVEWRYSEYQDEWPDYPLIFGTNAGQPIPSKDQSGEEWWYAHDNSYDSNGDFDGYIAGGYVTYNWDYDESGVTQGTSGTGGCQRFMVNENTCYDCEEFETQGNVKGRDYAVVWKKDKSGRDYEWDKVLVLGSILNIKHTSDGGYIAVGLSHSSRKLDGSPLFYNPDVNGTLNDFNCSNGIEWESNPCDSQDPRDTRRFGYACKLNHDGDIEWEALFGTSDHALVENDSYNTFSSMIWDVVETSSGFVLVGESDVRNSQGYAINGGNTTNNWRSAAMWMVNKDGEIFIDNGQLQLGFLPDYFTSRGIASGLAVYNSSIDSEEKVVVSGFREINCPTPINNQRMVFVAQFNNANLFPEITGDYEWVLDDATINASLCGQNNLTWDVEINKNIPEQIILPVLYDCGTGGGGPNNSCAEARVYRLDAASGVYINHVDFGHVETYDLKIAVSVKPDGGFAMVSTRRNNPPVPSVYCGSPQRQIITVSWGASAYIGCVDPNDNILWATTIDRNNEQAAAYNNFPADMKKMECVYSISQAPDGGYVVAGNNSDNFDDFYMVKLFSDCEADHTLYDNYSTSEANNFTEEITTNTTWSIDRTLLGSVHIKNGAKLTINSAAVIKFADSKRLARADGTNIITNLVVEPGGQLELLDDATLDAANNCSNSMWDGVQVWGNPFLPQTIANQGYMVMNNGNIKNARIGISAAKYDYDLYANQNETFTGGGGLIRVSYSTLENCRKSAYLGPYPLPLGLNASWNKSFFNNTTFACNQPMRDYLYQIPGSSTQNFGVNEHLSIYGTNGILITHSYFSNTASGLDLDQRGNGIHTAEASARIANGCEFTSLNKAVHAQFAAFMNGINVDGGNKFIDNRQSILLEGGFGSSIAGNDFNIPEDAAGAQLPFGVLTVNAEGFAIENNQFAGANNTGAPNFGVVVNNSGALNTGADVRNNGFSGLYVGTSTVYNNDALRISCNNYSDYRYAWMISLFGNGTLGDQGTGCDPSTQERAGNLFYDDDTETEENIWNNAPPFLYYAWGDPAETDPTSFDPNDVSINLQSGSIVNCSQLGDDDYSCPAEEPCTDPNCIELLQQRLSGLTDHQQWMELYNEIARYYVLNDSTGIDDAYFAFLASVADSSIGIAATLASEAIRTGQFVYADSILDEIDVKLDDSCFTSIDRLLITMLADSSGINELTNSDWSSYQSCLDQSNPSNYRYEMLEDIIDLMDHPRELLWIESARLKAPEKESSEFTPVLGCKNNPGSGVFEIYSISNMFKINNTKFEVLNSYGQSVESGIITQETSTYNLNLTSMPAGVYTFILYTNNSKRSHAKIKLVKL